MPVRSVTGSVAGRSRIARPEATDRLGRRPVAGVLVAPRRRAAGRPGAGSGRRSCRWSPGSRRGRRGARGCARGGWRARRAGRADRPHRRTTGARAPRRRRARHAARPRGAAGRSTGCRCRAGARSGPGGVGRARAVAGPGDRAGRDEGAGSVPPLDPALGGQLVVGLLGHRPRDAQVAGERPRARQPRRRPGACRPGRRRGSGPATWLLSEVSAPPVEAERERERSWHAKCPVRIRLTSGPCWQATFPSD